jgi:hypothetical protein
MKIESHIVSAGGEGLEPFSERGKWLTFHSMRRFSSTRFSGIRHIKSRRNGVANCKSDQSLPSQNLRRAVVRTPGK